MPSAITYQPSSSSSSPRYLPDTQNIISFILSTLDRFVASPETREKVYNAVFRFCYQRPILSSFLGVQVIFAFVPLVCFVGFSVAAGLVVSALALGVGVFWVLVAGVVLFWALVITFTLAAATWVYLAVCFVTVRRIGRATGYIETPGGQRGGSANKGSNTTTTTNSSLQNGKGEDVKSDEKGGNVNSDEKEEAVIIDSDGKIDGVDGVRENEEELPVKQEE
ncbi:hypothetical protein TWF506_003186 [Arthrobotrys conoides]|uniref:Uncharacterized protein n=1 Tax=Arthrobotrys conoides TaxID=74498 RepID=A0AAN8NCC1_9PEZI